AGELGPHDGVMRVEQGVPVTVTHLGGSARRVHDVGEQHRGENPIIGHVGLLAGEELGDLLEGLAPSRFNLVVPVAAWQLNIFRVGMCSAMYLPFAGGMSAFSAWWTTSVGTRIVGRTARTSSSVMSGIKRARFAGLAARRSIRAHVARISSFHGMSGFIRR